MSRIERLSEVRKRLDNLPPTQSQFYQMDALEGIFGMVGAPLRDAVGDLADEHNCHLAATEEHDDKDKIGFHFTKKEA